MGLSFKNFINLQYFTTNDYILQHNRIKTCRKFTNTYSIIILWHNIIIILSDICKLFQHLNISSKEFHNKKNNHFHPKYGVLDSFRRTAVFSPNIRVSFPNSLAGGMDSCIPGRTATLILNRLIWFLPI